MDIVLQEEHNELEQARQLGIAVQTEHLILFSEANNPYYVTELQTVH
jgi:hypothetical protein